jgi:hypothetical protein
MLPQCQQMSHVIVPKCHFPFLCKLNVNKCFSNVTNYSTNVTVFKHPTSTMDIVVTIQISSQKNSWIFYSDYNVGSIQTWSQILTWFLYTDRYFVTIQISRHIFDLISICWIVTTMLTNVTLNCTKMLHSLSL